MSEARAMNGTDDNMVYEVQRGQKELDDFFKSSEWPQWELEHVIRTYVPAELARTLFDWIEQILLSADEEWDRLEKEDNAPTGVDEKELQEAERRLEAASGLRVEVGGRRREYGLADPAVRAVLRKLINQGVADKIEQLDPFSKAAAMTTGEHIGPPQLDYKHYSEFFFLEPFDKPGTFCYTTGPVDAKDAKHKERRHVGVGKTATNFTYMEMFLKHGRHIMPKSLMAESDIKGVYQCLVNTDVVSGQKMPEGMRFCDSLPDLLESSTRSMMNRVLTVANLDEFTQEISKEYGNAKAWVNFKKFLYVSRRPGIIMFTTSQREMEIPTAIQEMAVGHIQKRTQTMMRFRRGNDIYIVKNIPMTTIPYETEYSSFDFESLDISDMHQYLRDHRGEENQPKLILEYLGKKNVVTKADLMRAAQVLYYTGNQGEAKMTQQHICEHLGIVQSQCSEFLAKSPFKPENGAII